MQHNECLCKTYGMVLVHIKLVHKRLYQYLIFYTDYNADCTSSLGLHENVSDV